MQKYINMLSLLLTGILVISCGGGGSSSSTQPLNNDVLLSDLNKVSVSGLTEYPAYTKGETYVTVNNNSNSTISGLTYSLGGSTANITIDNNSANNCAVLSAQQSCNLKILFNDANTNPGAFSVIVNGSNATTSVAIKAATSTLTKMSGVGLVNIPNNILNGASGAVVLVPDTISQNSNGVTPVVVTVVVNSVNIGNVNTFALVDTVSKKPLSFASTLSGNNLNGGSNYTKGETVSFLLNIPNGIKQVTFLLQAAKDTTNNISYSGYPTVINLVNNQAVVNLVPSQSNLSASTKTQQVYAVNSGDATATGLNLPAITLNDGHKINVSAGNNKPCGSNLASGNYCSYTVSFDTSQIVFPGSATLNLSYNNGSSIANSYALVNYSAINPDAGTLSVTGSIYKFNATTASPVVTGSLLIQNTSTSLYTESNITVTLPQYFSLVNSGNGNSCDIINGNKIATVLQPGDSCSVSLVYTNAIVTPPSLANLTVSYSYTNGINNGNATLNPIGLMYSTSQAQASLSFTNQNIVFRDIANNNRDLATQAIQLVNNGQVAATDLNFTLASSFGIYTITGSTCGSSLAAGASCNVNVQFGPTLIAKSYDNTLIANYAVANSQVQATTNLIGTAIDSAEANLVIENVSSVNSVAGNGTSSESSFQIQQAANNQLKLTYKNIGNSVANNININTAALANGYSLVQNQCTGNLAINSSCAVTLSIPNTSGANNLALSSLLASWRDGAGQHNNQIIYWQDASNQTIYYSMVYVNIFEAAHITLTSPVDISSAIPGASFNLVVTLVGGYQVQNTVVNLSTNGVNISPSSCDVSSNNPTCSTPIVTTSPTQATGQYTINATSALGVASFPFMLNVGKVIYVTSRAYSSNLMAINNSSNGIVGADYACQNDLQVPSSNTFTYKAMITDSSNRSITNNWIMQPKMLYVRSDYLTPIGITNESATLDFPWENSISSHSSHVWTGFNGGANVNAWKTNADTCYDWTGGGFGKYGDSQRVNYYAIAASSVSCKSANARLYCVQQ